MDKLGSQSMGSNVAFNWIFLIELLVCSIVTVFFLFYFNRVVGKIVSVALRAYLRTARGTPVHIDIQSLQVSLLAGRIFFGRVTYHGSNESIQIVGGHITWRYWLRKVKHCNGDEASSAKVNDLPSRILVKLHGLEWFVYNRSPAYDAIWAEMGEPASANSESAPATKIETDGDGGIRGVPPPTSPLQEKLPQDSLKSAPQSDTEPNGNVDNESQGARSDFPSNLLFLRILPIKIECHKGGIVMGNNNTPSILVAQFRNADVTIEAHPSRGPDLYKQVINVNFVKPVISFKENFDFKELQQARGARIMTEQPPQNRIWTTVRDLLPVFHLSVESLAPNTPPNNRATGQGRWVGLARYLDESEEQDRFRFQPAEYAKVTTILDSPEVQMSMFWDSVGNVSVVSDGTPRKNPGNNINGDIPPQWGIDLSIGGGTVNYGPWADRQRAELQNMFFPRLFKDATPAVKLQPGVPRQPTNFTLFVEFKESALLRIPVREESKDWKFRRRLNEGELRGFGWIDLKIGSGSTISNSTAMVATETGWDNKLHIDFKNCEVRTSVNHGLLLRTEQLGIVGDLSNPLKWNGAHHWFFDISSQSLRLFLLREHVTLITDLVSDWASGPPQEYFTFSPFQYSINLNFNHFEIYLNVNDGNIINNPSNLDDNTFLILKGDILKSLVRIPLHRFRPPSNEIPFDIFVAKIHLAVHTPAWNTQASFLENTDVASVNDLVLRGKYKYHASTGPELIDTLLLEIVGNNVDFTLHGFLIRYFLIIRENYFGENLHFKTLEEYKRKDAEVVENVEKQTSKSNDLDVILSIEATNGAVLLPAHLYSAQESVRLEIALLSLDMRFTNFYMDLQINISPISASLSSTNDYIDAASREWPTQTQLFIDGLVIYGHRLFGLPPSEPTYVCNWDLSLGALTGECTPDFLRTLIFGLKSFDFSMDDVENALPHAEEVLSDVTFVRVAVKSVQIWLRVAPSAFLISTEEIKFSLNDWSNEQYSDRISLVIPSIILACVDEESAQRQKGKSPALPSSSTIGTKTNAYLSTNLDMTVFGIKNNARKERVMQQQHVKDHDFRTGRASFLLRRTDESGLTGQFVADEEVTAPSMSVPSMPPPLYAPSSPYLNHMDGPISESSPSHMQSIRRKTSFLTSRSSSGSSTSRTNQTASSISPSFHSAVQTVSETLLPTPPTGRLRPESPVHSSISRSPTHRAPSSIGKRKLGSSTNLSSNFNQPYFPLQGTKLDLRSVPILDEEPVNSQHDVEPSPEHYPNDLDEMTSQNSIMIDLGKGICGFCNPTAIRNIKDIIERMQPQSVNDVLDAIHIDVIGKLAKLTKRVDDVSKILEFCIRIPQVKFRLVNPNAQSITSTLGLQQGVDEDVITLQAVKTLIMARSKEGTVAEANLGRGTTDSSLSAHFFLQHLQLTLGQAKQDSRGLMPSALRVSIEDVIASVSTSQLTTASIKVKAISSALASNQATFLCGAGLRTSALVSELADSFASLGKQKKKRSWDLIHALATAQEAHGILHEPSCITRPSHVLSPSPNRVRVHESWKMNSRIRHIHKSLPEVVQHELDARCTENTGSSPPTAFEQVIRAFDKWRGWDLVDIQNSYFIQGVFGTTHHIPKPVNQSSTSRMDISLDRIIICVDPGPAQQEAHVDGFHGVVSMAHVGAPPNSPSNQPTVIESGNASIVMQAHCRNAQIKFTWEVLELVENLMKYFAEQPPPPQTPKNQESAVKAKSEFKRELHLVLTADSGSIGLDTVNLKLLCIGHSLRTSFVASEKSRELQEGLLGSLLLHADITSSELSCQNKVLSVISLRQPAAYVYLDQHCVADTTFNYWKSAGTCQYLSFELREEVLGLMEVIDFLVNDEISQIYRLVKEIEKFNPPASKKLTANVSHPRRTVNLIDVALNLDDFLLSANLLPSLAYVVRGRRIRLSARPKNKTETVFEFDLLHHEHEIRTGLRSSPISISLLQIPAINGRIRQCSTVDENLLEVFFSCEAIQFDASAIQSLANALNKPEVVNVIEIARKDWVVTQARLNQLFGPPKPKELQKNQGPRLIYRAHVGIAGLTIESRAPSANLEIDLGAIQVYASNKPNLDSNVLDLPEIFVELKHITASLLKNTPNQPTDTCGKIELHASLLLTSKAQENGKTIRAFYLKSNYLQVDLFAETASTVVDVAGHLQDRLKDLDLSPEVKYLRKLGKSNRPRAPLVTNPADLPLPPDEEDDIFSSIFSVDLKSLQIAWIVGNSIPQSPTRSNQNLVLSFKRIGFESAITKHNEAQLIIEQLLLQMVDEGVPINALRSENSALLPEIAFNVAYHNGNSERRFAFQAKGLPLDIKLNAGCMLGVIDLQSSISTASAKFRKASESWKSTPTVSGGERKKMFGKKRLASVLVDADFAGAVVHFQTSHAEPESAGLKQAQQGRFGQFSQSESGGVTTLRSPGLAFKVQYLDSGKEDPSLSGEIKVSGSQNIIFPSIVPLLLEMSNSLKDVVREPSAQSPPLKPTKNAEEDKIPADAAAILGKVKLDLGLRIMKQEFSLSCQPYARVAATASYSDIYITVNTCEDADGGRFYSISAITKGLRCSLQHIYSRESTGYLEVEALAVSIMNNKHLSGSDGLSCIVKLSPLKAQVNVKQLQDFLLFREIWFPEQVLNKVPSPTEASPEQPTQLMQKYHKVTATKAFPWNTTIAISTIDLQLDLGPSLGKNALHVSDFWIASRKSSDWEQTMCVGLGSIGVKASGRLSGFVELVNLRARTSIQWSPGQEELTPLVQASLGFEQFRVKMAFDYQPFLIADIATFDFFMYNVREIGRTSDRLVGVLDGDKVQIFCTTQSSAQGLALYQAFLRLYQEKLTSYEASLKDIERFIKVRAYPFGQPSTTPIPKEDPMNFGARPEPSSLKLHTDVVVNLREINIGAFHNSFRDSPVFKLEALNVGARFAVEMEGDRLHSQLGMTLGELRVSLAGVKKSEDIGLAVDVKVEDVISNATSAKGGTILKVPQVKAAMDTWHVANSNQIDYIFKSAFEGKVDVGWNYARVSFIKSMWANHVQAMSQRKVKHHPSSSSTTQNSQSHPIAFSINATNISPASPLSPAVPVPVGSDTTSHEGGNNSKEEPGTHNNGDKGKITAVVNVPQSRYEYKPLEPPLIETPQLRDMGEATPPLEWIGLNRDRLPNLTHQIVIVSLLEVAKEVEDAYNKILGAGS
ncbi:hypothetical protein DFH27DRAFT_276125 [Peziza echinospora]|nr:hypothetical protein DFH27DRAFT_276125 [Peziza echinospora]